MNSQNASCASLSKDEVRKMRNRKSAQSSREKKRLQLEWLTRENAELQARVADQDKEIMLLRCENDKLRYHVKLYEDLK